jgi:hypothetical protein
MAATLTYERFAGPEWIFERKIDGIRLLAFKKGEGIQLFSRNRLPQNVPPVATALALLPASVLSQRFVIKYRREPVYAGRSGRRSRGCRRPTSSR